VVSSRVAARTLRKRQVATLYTESLLQKSFTLAREVPAEGWFVTTMLQNDV
jgi:hypothetical protein